MSAAGILAGPHGLLARLRRHIFQTTAGPLYVATAPEAVPASLYHKLVHSFPAPPMDSAKARKGDYGYLRHTACSFDDGLPAVWRSVWNYLLSVDYLTDALRFWEDPIRKLYPQVLMKPRTRFIRATPPGDAAFEMEGQFAWRIPRAVDHVLLPHIDSPRSLLFGLWYFPVPGDEGRGGDLQFLEPRGDGSFKLLLTVPYGPNQVVLCLNSPASWHAGTVRVGATKPRRHVNFTIELPDESLFTPDTSQRGGSWQGRPIETLGPDERPLVVTE